MQGVAQDAVALAMIGLALAIALGLAIALVLALRSAGETVPKARSVPASAPKRRARHPFLKQSTNRSDKNVHAVNIPKAMIVGFWAAATRAPPQRSPSRLTSTPVKLGRWRRPSTEGGRAKSVSTGRMTTSQGCVARRAAGRQVCEIFDWLCELFLRNPVADTRFAGPYVRRDSRRRDRRTLWIPFSEYKGSMQIVR